jgi:hypothetical protein
MGGTAAASRANITQFWETAPVPYFMVKRPRSGTQFNSLLRHAPAARKIYAKATKFTSQPRVGFLTPFACCGGIIACGREHRNPFKS